MNMGAERDRVLRVPGRPKGVASPTGGVRKRRTPKMQSWRHLGRPGTLITAWPHWPGRF
jgi:hypothetical protein